jgi:hypothetical protein
MHGSLVGGAAISLPSSARRLPLRRRCRTSAAACRAAAGRGSHTRWQLHGSAGTHRPAATALQTVMTLFLGSDADARIPMLGASGAISAVLGAFLVLYPHARIKTLVLVFIVRIPAWAYLGGWFLYQLSGAHDSLLAASGGGGVAFFAHVGGFVFGWVVTRALLDARQIRPQPEPGRLPPVPFGAR